jgi:hypothetical protein
MSKSCEILFRLCCDDETPDFLGSHIAHICFHIAQDIHHDGGFSIAVDIPVERLDCCKAILSLLRTWGVTESDNQSVNASTTQSFLRANWRPDYAAPKCCTSTPKILLPLTLCCTTFGTMTTSGSFVCVILLALPRFATLRTELAVDAIGSAWFPIAVPMPPRMSVTHDGYHLAFLVVTRHGNSSVNKFGSGFSLTGKVTTCSFWHCGY